MGRPWLVSLEYDSQPPEKESGKLIRINEEEVKSHLNQLVLKSVEETLNGLLDAEANSLLGAERYEPAADRQGTRAGHYTRGLHTTTGEVTLKAPKLRELKFEKQIIERYRRKEASGRHHAGAVGKLGLSQHGV